MDSLRGSFGGLHAAPQLQAQKRPNGAGTSLQRLQLLPGSGWQCAGAKKRRKQSFTSVGGPLLSAHARTLPSSHTEGTFYGVVRLAPPIAEIQVRELLKTGQNDQALSVFLECPSGALAATQDLLDALIRGGNLQGSISVLAASKPLGPLPQPAALALLQVLPQDTPAIQGRRLAELLATASPWEAPQHEAHFRRTVRALVLEFLEEANVAISNIVGTGSGRTRGGNPIMGVFLEKGQQEGELKVQDFGEMQGRWGAPSDSARGMLPSDAVGVTPIGGLGAGKVLECEVVVAKPLILRLVNKNDPAALLLLQGGPYRLDKLANRVCYTRMLCASHCLAEPARRQGEDKGVVRLQRRLPAKHRPNEAVRQVLISERLLAEGTVPRLKSSARCSERNAFCAPDVGDLSASNDSQKAAIFGTMVPASLVQGPPGTGKTKTCVRILKFWSRTWAKREGRRACILATSDSNIAVDNLLEGLVSAGVKAVRLGRPETTRPEAVEHTADQQAARKLGIASLRDVDRQIAQKAMEGVIEDAEVVCCTAIGAGAALLRDFTFHHVLLDEAAQATEPASLVPLCRGCQRFVLVGDHCQLPPTVTSDVAAKVGLSLSLFERLASEGSVVPTLLEVQYRMHPSISAFPCMTFYDGTLKDGVAAADRIAPAGFAWPDSDRPVAVLTVAGVEHCDGTSFINDAEAQEVVRIVSGLAAAGTDVTTIGVTAPYGAQARLVKRLLHASGFPTGRDRNGVEVSSVDGYQGREKDVIVVSTVRASNCGGLGFVTDWRRMNVAFTRARCGLIVVCHPPTLARDGASWRPWLHWAKDEGFIISGSQPFNVPALDAAAPPVGLAALRGEGAAARRYHSPSRSPPPPWKMRHPTVTAAGAAVVTSSAAQAAAFDPSLMPVMNKPGRIVRMEAEDDDDDRVDAVVSTSGRPRDVGVSGPSVFGLCSRVSAVRGHSGRDGSGPSPFIGGARVDLSQAEWSLSLKQSPAVQKATKRAQVQKRSPMLSSLGALVEYASSESSDGEDRECEVDEEDDESEDKCNAVPSMCRMEGTASAGDLRATSARVPDVLDENAGEYSSDGEEVCHDVLAEFL